MPLNSMQIKKKYDRLNYQKVVANINGNTELYEHLAEKIRVLKEYAKLRGFYIGTGSFLYQKGIR